MHEQEKGMGRWFSHKKAFVVFVNGIANVLMASAPV